jgi:hypothetical protein
LLAEGYEGADARHTRLTTHEALVYIGLTEKSECMWVIFLALLVAHGSCFAPGVISDTVPPLDALYSSLYYAYAAFCPDGPLLAWNCTWCTHNPTFHITALLYNDTTQVLCTSLCPSASSRPKARPRGLLVVIPR